MLILSFNKDTLSIQIKRLTYARIKAKLELKELAENCKYMYAVYTCIRKLILIRIK